METSAPAHHEVAVTPHATAWYRVSRWVFRALGWLLFRISVSGRSNVPPGNYIVVANHLSWIDPFLLMMYLPAEPRLYFIGAQQAVNQGWKGWIVDHFDMLIPVQRGAAFVGREVLEKPKHVLTAGAVLGLFPEGCLGPKEGEMLPLERGIGHILLGADHPVLPVAISGAQELYLRKQVAVRIGEPLQVATEGLGRHQAIDAGVEQVAVALRRLLPAYQEPRPAFKAMRFLSNLLDIGLPHQAAKGGD
jgi:1-acyl-sn-glycerol-3-phosphate acyltransferase